MPISDSTLSEIRHEAQGSAPVYHGEPVHRSEVEARTFQLTDRRLAGLQKIAVHDLLGWLDVPAVPSLFYEILRQEEDPGRTIEIYAERLGCDPLAVRRRDPWALARLQSLSLLYHQFETDRSAPAREQRDKLESMLFFGHHERVEALIRIYATLNEARAIFLSLDHLQIAAVERQAVVLEDLRVRPDNVEESVAVELLDVAQEIEQFVERMAAADRQLTEFQAAIDVWGAERSLPNEIERALKARERFLKDDAAKDLGGAVRDYESAVKDIGRAMA